MAFSEYKRRAYVRKTRAEPQRGLVRSPKSLRTRFNQASRFRPPSSRQICLNPVMRVGCEGSRGEPEQSEGERSEAEDRSPPSQTGFRQILRRSGENKPVA